MNSQSVPFTLKLGRGANIRLGNAEIHTGVTGATIRFGSFEAPIVVPTTAPAAAVVRGMPIGGRIGGKGPRPTEQPARRAYLPVQPAKAAGVTAAEAPRKRASVFERLTYSEAPASKKTLIKSKVRLEPVYNTSLPTEPFAPGNNDAEASSSGGKLSRKQRRKLNARLRAQHLLPEQPAVQQSPEPAATIPTHNKLTR